LSQEAHAASALNHPHIITIYEIESSNGNDFIVMEYVRGKSLDALLSAGSDARSGMSENIDREPRRLRLLAPQSYR